MRKAEGTVFYNSRPAKKSQAIVDGHYRPCIDLFRKLQMDVVNHYVFSALKCWLRYDFEQANGLI